MQGRLTAHSRMDLWQDVLTVVTILMYFFAFSMLFRALTYLADLNKQRKNEERSTEHERFQFWVQLEVMLVLAILASNMTFLMFRFWFVQKPQFMPIDYEQKLLILERHKKGETKQ